MPLPSLGLWADDRRLQFVGFLMAPCTGQLMSRLRERQTQLLTQHHVPNGTAPRLEQYSPRRDNRPSTAGHVARPKVTCQMLNETERMLLKAPNRHKSMLSAGTCYADTQ